MTVVRAPSRQWSPPRQCCYCTIIGALAGSTGHESSGATSSLIAMGVDEAAGFLTFLAVGRPPVLKTLKGPMSL
ncbi:hypothetical protein GQ53DRAFT_747063 [Thozetella sp. PMI_491]|nr:hypothetical protein GQ53DRAFT_747063 [Thozetella sp. PMI_491]